MDENDLRNMIRKKTRLTLSLEEPFRSPSRTDQGRFQLGRVREIASHIIMPSKYLSEYLEIVFGWIEANPNKKGLAAAIKSVYLFSQKEETDPSNYVNTKEGYEAFYNELSDKQHRILFLIGPKGSGKTFFLNYLFNVESNKLYNEKNIIWFRAEISKVYRHRINKKFYHPQMNVPYTLKEYLALHITYVTFKYRKSNPIFMAIYNDEDAKITEMLIDEWLKNDDLQKNVESPDLLVDQFKSFIEKVELEEKSLGESHRLTQNHINGILSQHAELCKCSLLSEVIIKYLKNNNYQSIIVIDGADNIDYYLNSEHYSDILREIKELFLTDDKPNQYGSKVILSLRDETYEHIKSMSPFFYTKWPPEYRIKPVMPTEVLSKKVIVAIKPTCDYFIKHKGRLETKIENQFNKEGSLNKSSFISSFYNDFQEFHNNFLSMILNAITRIIPEDHNLKTGFDEQVFFKLFYHYNLRAFLANFINIYKYVRLFSDKRKATTHRSYLLTEGQLLNGSLYLDTRNSPYEFGKCIPNIFWFHQIESGGVWHGLCGYRILQTLKKYPLDKNELFRMLEKRFKYKIEVIKCRFFYLLSHGLLRAEFSTRSKKRLFYLSEKGNFYLDYVFFDINQFYYIALDTPLSNYAIERTLLIRVHRNENTYWEDYTESCVLTSITFLRHILTQHMIEIESFNNDLIKCYDFPSHFTSSLIKEMIVLIKTLKKINISRYQELLNDIKGVAV